jgi:hypothetical protein
MAHKDVVSVYNMLMATKRKLCRKISKNGPSANDLECLKQLRNVLNRLRLKIYEHEIEDMGEF